MKRKEIISIVAIVGLALLGVCLINIRRLEK